MKWLFVASRVALLLSTAAALWAQAPHAVPVASPWSGTASSGLTMVRSTQTATTFTAALNLAHDDTAPAVVPLTSRTYLNLSESLSDSSTPVIPQTKPASAPVTVKTDIFHGDLEQDRYLHGRIFALADVAFDHNYAQSLQGQQIEGAGAGWTAVRNLTGQLDLRADLHFEKQAFFTAKNDTSLVGSMFQENYRHQLPRHVVFSEWADILPTWNNRKAYAANGYAAVTMPLFRRLNTTVSATDNYLNDPSPGYRTNSLQVVTSLSLSLTKAGAVR